MDVKLFFLRDVLIMFLIIFLIIQNLLKKNAKKFILMLKKKYLNYLTLHI